mmetsp:Transcript_23015/g.59033  ORF Transcript_23015/g.59033 Transcript_23015/m.59033 type:complete len:687 (-) Transcript_23015:117-2177(-)|eukprot:jgi/Tetstr1/429452/TSEL_019360.t1
MGFDFAKDPKGWLADRAKSATQFWSVKVAQLLCVIYILVLTFSDYPLGLVNPPTGNIIDFNSEENTANGVIQLATLRPVVAETPFQMLCLAISRMSAFSLYPAMVLVFFSKCKATLNFLESSPVSMGMFKDIHELHIYCGHYIAFDVWVHTLFHLLRWGTHGNISLLWTSQTGITGLVVVLATPLITFPMMYFKKTLRYEIRKALHYLFYLFAIGMCFHVPPSAVPNGGFIAYILGICIGWYTLDALYVFFVMTEKIDTTTFHVLPSGVQMTMAVSPAFAARGKQGGFAYVCLPWVAKDEWHAFSLFEDPVDPSCRQVFMLKTGDWTAAVHASLQRNTVRPVWVQGPFASPYNHAIDFDNQVLVASGIGITPALSVIRAHRDTRRVNLIWAVRDPAMLEFFLERFDLPETGWNLIFYTGKKDLSPHLDELRTNVRVVHSRPNLHAIIPNIIYGIETGEALPESYLGSKADRVRADIEKLAETLRADDGGTPIQKIKKLHDVANRHGFNFNDLCDKFDWVGSPPVAPEDVSTEDALPPKGSNRSKRFTPASFRGQKFTLDNINESDLLSGGSAVEAEGKGGEPAAQIDRKSFDTAPDLIERILTRRSVGLGQSELDNMEMERAQTCYTGLFSPGVEAKAAGYVKDLPKEVVRAWGILYCGGSKPVEEALHSISRTYGISLDSESFAW